MQRRDFLARIALVVGGIAVATSGVVSKAARAAGEIVWVKEKKLNYVEKAPADKVTAGKTCASCGYYVADAAVKGGGKCTFAGMKSAMAAKGDVYVKEGGFCPMWKKKA